MVSSQNTKTRLEDLNLDVLRNLPNMNLEDGRQAAIDALEKLKFNRTRKFSIKMDLTNARSIAHITGIMWRLQQAGEGQRVVGSTWKQRF